MSKLNKFKWLKNSYQILETIEKETPIDHTKYQYQIVDKQDYQRFIAFALDTYKEIPEQAIYQKFSDGKDLPALGLCHTFENYLKYSEITANNKNLELVSIECKTDTDCELWLWYWYALTTLEQERKQHQKVFVHNTPLLNSKDGLLSINTRTHDKAEFERYDHSVLRESIKDKQDKRISYRVLTGAWEAGKALDLFIFTGNQLKLKAKSRKLKKEHKAGLIIDADKRYNENKKNSCTKITLSFQDMLLAYGKEHNQKNIDWFREDLKKAVQNLMDIKIEVKIDNDITKYFHLYEDPVINDKTQTIEILARPQYVELVRIGAFHPIPIDVFRIDNRNAYAKQIYIKLCFQAGNTRQPKRLTGYNYAISVKALCEGSGIWQAYKAQQTEHHSARTTELKNKLTGALNALKVLGVEWVYSNDGIKERSINAFLKQNVCFNLPRWQDEIVALE